MTRKIRQVANVVRGELPDGEVVISVAGGDRALILNSVADAVLELCDGSHTIADIAQFICDTLEVPATTDVARDIAAVIEELSRAGVVEMIE